MKKKWIFVLICFVKKCTRCDLKEALFISCAPLDTVIETHVELQGLGPLSNHSVARPGDVVPLVLEQVVASRGVAITVECH